MERNRCSAICVAFLLVLLPFTAAESIAAGEACSPFNDQCEEGTYCSGQKNAFQMTRCCPDGSEFNFYLNECFYQCVDRDGDGYGKYCSLGEDCDDTNVKIKECDVANENNDKVNEPSNIINPSEQNIIRTKCVPGVCNDDGDINCDGIVDQTCLQSEEVVLLENDMCHVWEVLRNDVCEIDCPSCDLDNDGVETQVEVRYYANPVVEEDDPINRIVQRGCPDYYSPEILERYTNERGSVNTAQFLAYLRSPEEYAPDSLGNVIGLPHGTINGVLTDALGLFELALLPFKTSWTLIQDVYETGGDPFELIERRGYRSDQNREALMEVISNPAQVWAGAKNEWFDERSQFAGRIYDFDNECSDVTLNKGYTLGYSSGFIAAQVALLLLPVSKFGWVAKIKVLLKFKSFSRLAGKGAKIFEKAGEIRWLSTLPDTEGRALAEKIARIAAGEGHDVAVNVARRAGEVGKILGSEGTAKLIATPNYERYLKISKSDDLIRWIENGEDIVGKNHRKILPAQKVVDPGRVNEHFDKIMSGKEVDPIEIIIVEGKGKYINDGHHRYVAFKKAGYGTSDIPTTVDYEYSFGGFSSWSKVKYGDLGLN
jgi:hypothetical protein